MAKTLLSKELYFLDFYSKEFKYYNVEVLSIGYNDIQVIFHYGKLNNKGRETIKRFQGKNAYKNAMKEAYNKINEKKYSEGYLSRDKVDQGIKFAKKQERIEAIKSKNKNQEKYKCDLCESPINPKLYEKINKWGRTEGNWDYSEESPYYKKVICLNCQIDEDIFQRKVEPN